MNRLLLQKAVLLLSLVAGAFFNLSASANDYSRNLVIVADPTMYKALTKIARIYSKENNVIVSVSFDSSDKLISDLDAGEEINLLISANYYQMKILKQKALFDVYNSPIIALDRAVLATSATNSQIPSEFSNNKITLIEAIKILGKNNIGLTIDGQESFLGKYSQDLASSIVNTDLKLDILSGDDKDELIDHINSENNYGILFLSQAKSRNDIKIITNHNQNDIGYKALIIAGDNMELAREFVEFIQSKESKAILSDAGFIVN